MTTGHDALSILAAARDAGPAVALRAGGRSYTFAQLADMTRARQAAVERDARPGVPFPVVGTNTLATLVTVYALLEARIPMLMLHPRLRAPERDALLRAAQERGRLAGDDAAAVLFTSGTTGQARAAVLSRSAFVASARASEANLGWRDDDRWLACITVAHVGGLSIVTRCLAARRALVLAERFDAAQFPEWIERDRVTLASVVPTMLAMVLDAHPDWRAPAWLRGVLVGGAGASRRLLARATAHGVPVLPTYGLTETCAQVTTVRIADVRSAPDAGAGPPLPGADVRVVDGHIEVRGDMLMSGYWNEPPLARGAWFDTGDLGEFDAHGNLHVYARRSDLIVTGGENVYPAEVEQALEALPGIAAAGVFGVPDERWGETVAAALVADGVVPDATLFAHVDACLAPHKRPRRVCFVDRLPSTPGGKLDRRALARLASSLRPLPAPAGD
ncbi:MAG: AMP-binding protein [Burkholderiales bacterium]